MVKLSLFQTSDELNKLMQSFDLSDKTNILVALTPEADYAAKKNDLNYKTIEEFYSDPELMELGVKGFAKVRDFCLELDRHLFQALKNIPEVKDISTYDDFFDFNHVYDALLHRASTLVSVITKISPELIVYFSYPSLKGNIKDDMSNNRLISRILPIIASHLNIKTATLQKHKKTDYYLLANSIKYKWLYPSAGYIRNLLARKLKKKCGLLFSKVDIKNHDDIITLIGDRHSPFDEGHIIRKWIDSGAGDFFTLGQIMEFGENASGKEICHLNLAVSKACAGAWEQIDCDTIQKFFQIAEIDLYPLIKSFLKNYICYTIPARIIAARKLRIGLSRIRKGAIIGPYVQGWVARMAKQTGIKTIAFQHGGGYGYLDRPMAEHELSGTGYFFCYGTGVTEFYKNPSPYAQLPAGALRPAFIPIGSPSLDILKQKEQVLKSDIQRDGSNKTVVYVTTNLGGDNRYFTFSYCPDIWFWRLQQKIIETCTSSRNIQLIVKLYSTKGIRKEPIHNPVRDWLKDAALPKCKALDDIPFTDLLSVGDLFIIDYPTTTLLQAMITEKPIITFADKRWLKLDSAVDVLLRKRAILTDSIEQFLYEIDTFLQKPDWNLPKPVNNEFLMAYGTHLNDGRSIERAINLIRDLTEKRSDTVV